MAFARESIKGSIPALITPMRGGKVDEAAFRKLVSWQIAQGQPRTGALRHHRRIADAQPRRAHARGGNLRRGSQRPRAGDRRRRLEFHRRGHRADQHAKKVGADAVLSVTGYYNKPSQEGLYRHYAALAEAVDIPILLYNIPGRAIVDISVETMARLSKIANIIGVKDATANLARPTASAPPAAGTGG